MMRDYWDVLILSRKVYQESLEPVCERFSLTRLELDILLFLANNPQFDTATDLVEKRRMAKSHVSVSVGKLKKHGYLEASWGENNRKTVHLRLLPPSEEIVEAGRKVQMEFFDRIFHGFTEEEQKKMGSMFHRIAENARGALMEE